MPLVVGIDEAGYGPLLGPLVVGATVWQVSPTTPDDYWQRLDEAVCRKPARHDSRLPVDDSKKLYSRSKGITALERSVLAFASAAGQDCATLGDLLDALGITLAGGPLPPWYLNLSEELPTDPVRAAYAGAADRLSRCMASAGVHCRGLMAELVTEAAFNDRVAQTRNKAAVLLEQVLRLVHRSTAAHADQDVLVHVDRLGGRQDYRSLLQTAFPHRHLHIVQVSDERSCYRLAARESDWTIDFSVNADQHSLPVALASMLAKYVRELIMRRLNAFWHELLPGLRPTAGYYSDARRFLTDIQPVVGQSGLRRERYVRQR